MSSAKVEIFWSPNHEDKFVICGTDLALYKVDGTREKEMSTKQDKAQCAMISESTYATTLSVNSDNQYMKCLAWYPHPCPDHLIAVGLANGKVALTSFGKGGASDPHGLIGKEFVPKHARQCNHLAWNPVEMNLLAEALDKHRSDHSILIWDVHAKPSTETWVTSERTGRFTSHIHTTETTITTKPLVEFGSNESTLSLDWFRHQPKTLVTGMNNKFLKIFDLRDIIRPQSVTYTKAVYGVCVDPHFENRIASYLEGQVLVWDTRNFDKPVLTLQVQEGRQSSTNHIVKLAWCPTRCGLLATLPKDSAVVKLYDIHNTTVGNDELDPAVIERLVQPYGTHVDSVVSSFDWHPTYENRLLTVSPMGTIKDVRDVHIFERIALTWTPDMYLTWACGRRLLQCTRNKFFEEVNQDISVKMKERALLGYGLQKDQLNKNAELVGNEPHLKSLWGWLNYVKGMSDEPKVKNSAKSANKFSGVRLVLRGDTSVSNSLPTLHSEQDYLLWQGLDGSRYRAQKKIYRGEERARALLLCGWGQDRDNFLVSGALEKMESEGNFERSAVIALFHLQIKRAIQALQRGALVRKHEGNVNLSVVAMALSGYTEDRNTLWKESCALLCKQLSNPYLRTMFAFLTADTDSYDDVLAESEMELMDRVAFACMYLPDAKLIEYTDKLMHQCIENGTLDGILLTGLTKDGLDLIERYVDITGDVQTASLAIIPALPQPDLSKDNRVHTWIEGYRSLLDSWRLWHQRAEFDVHKNMCDTGSRVFQQIYVSCNYCGKSTAFNMLNASRSRHFLFGGGSSHKSKITGCPNCRKPLPRCSLCLINMGTAAGTAKMKPRTSKEYADDEDRPKLTEFSNWFTWCQTCRHGGHASHVTEWFKEHTECPVTGCTCRCMSLDHMARTLPNDPHEGSTSPL